MTLEENVPIPENRGRGNPKYQFATMAIGDSFSPASLQDFIRARNASAQYGLRHGKKFSCLTMDDGTYRVWRTE